MINLSLNGFEQGSMILEIEAAVLRVMEKTSIHPKQINTELCEGKSEGCLMMTFVVKEASLDELLSLKKEFGIEFSITIIGKSKSELFLKLEAPRDNFLNLGKRYRYDPAQTPLRSIPVNPLQPRQP